MGEEKKGEGAKWAVGGWALWVWLGGLGSPKMKCKEMNGPVPRKKDEKQMDHIWRHQNIGKSILMKHYLFFM